MCVCVRYIESKFFKKNNLSATLAVVVLLLGQDDDQLAEDGDEVDKEIERVVDEVAVTHFESGHNHLGIVADVATHDKNSTV